jgi:Na+-transporting NADH:ubiquinone oxidoreductase subunit C
MSDPTSSPTPTPSGGWWQRFRGLPTDSTPKTVFVAVALCLFCSMVVSMAAVSLRPIQDANRLRDKRVNILQVAGLYEEGIDVDQAFAEAFEPRVVELETGTYTDAVDPVTYDQQAATADLNLSIALEDDPAGIGRKPNYATVYLLQDEQGAIDKIVLPIHGYGLWSTLFGFIALEEDANTIYGLQFYEHAETPGLGAEIDNPRWVAQWHGKALRDEEGELRITVSKPPAPAGAEEFHIDAIAGATLTSRGVDNLVRYWMGEQGFGQFLENLREGSV